MWNGENIHALSLAVRISGVDADGQVFSQLVTVHDVSQSGALLQGMRGVLLPVPRLPCSIAE